MRAAVSSLIREKMWRGSVNLKQVAASGGSSVLLLVPVHCNTDPYLSQDQNYYHH